jgi:hypothetical protein
MEGDGPSEIVERLRIGSLDLRLLTPGIILIPREDVDGAR